MKKVALESEILREVCEWLQKRRFFFWRNNNVPMFGRSNDGQMRYRAMPKFAMRGVADIIVIHRGKFIAIEVKRPGAPGGNPESVKAQKEFAERVRMNGGFYHTVHSSTEAETIPQLQLL